MFKPTVDAIDYHADVQGCLPDRRIAPVEVSVGLKRIQGPRNSPAKPQLSRIWFSGPDQIPLLRQGGAQRTPRGDEATQEDQSKVHQGGQCFDLAFKFIVTGIIC